MRRVNVHLPRGDIDTLTQYTTEIRKMATSERWKKVTSSDLIRFAISRVFGSRFHNKHIPKDILWHYIDRIREKRAIEPKSTLTL